MKLVSGQHTVDRQPITNQGHFNLAGTLEEERTHPQYFQPVPQYYVEISKLLFTEARAIFGSNSELCEVVTRGFDVTVRCTSWRLIYGFPQCLLRTWNMREFPKN